MPTLTEMKAAPKGARKGGGKATRVKRTYRFGQSVCEGRAEMRALLGGKGANLHAMTSRGFPVPPGFTITTQTCIDYYAAKRKIPEDLQQQVEASVAWLERETDKKFGSRRNPLLVSVRSGARDSMPGMMDTILNLGLNDDTVHVLADLTNNPRFAWDCYRRFIAMYGDVVLGIQKENENEACPFEAALHELKAELSVTSDTDLQANDLMRLVARYKKIVTDFTGNEFPQDPREQLQGAVEAVFKSWNNERAILYRNKYAIPHEWGTAVNVQAMVFGNMGDDSGTGVAFTRDAATGENVLYGEYLPNSQGEDVVAGIRTARPIAELQNDPHLKSVWKQLCAIRARLEKCFGDVQDFEFTIERKKLYMLQTRNAKRTARAAIKIVRDMVREKRMKPEYALTSIDAGALSQLLAPMFDPAALKAARKNGGLLTKGLAAGPGAGCGVISFSSQEAERLAAAGTPVILCRVETSPEDLRGMIAAQGILTTRGGVSSHAALVARQMGKVCVAGAGAIVIDYAQQTLTCNGRVLRAGDYIAIEGSTGEVFAGKLATTDSELLQVIVSETMRPEDSAVYQDFAFLMDLANNYRRLGVRTNADTPAQVAEAVAFGAEGIGLTRTEHMFFEGGRIDVMREMILAKTDDARAAALSKLLPLQRGDFEGIFRELGGRPACIRLLDPPLHEFLPNEEPAQVALAHKLGVTAEVVGARVKELHETNPMLGHRGCRLGISYPAITKMQVRAILEAAVNAFWWSGVLPKPEIMIPLVGSSKEFEHQAAVIREVAEEVFAEKGCRIAFQIGTMIELPIACVAAEKIAKGAEFFSFGTNDLTQTAFGISRDDMGTFYDRYVAEQIFAANPFATLDNEGVAPLIQMACDGGRRARPDIKLGICGEHGGDPASIAAFEKCGLSYVSCSPRRVPIAIVAAAAAAIKQGTVPAAGKKKRKS